MNLTITIRSVEKHVSDLPQWILLLFSISLDFKSADPTNPNRKALPRETKRGRNNVDPH